MGEVREKCAVVGAFGPDAAELTAQALSVLDHRGPDWTGIGGIAETGGFENFHAKGRASEVLTEERIAQLRSLGLVAAGGHARYPTSGGADKCQPIEAGEGKGRLLYMENGTGSYLRPLEDDLDGRNVSTHGANDSDLKALALADRRRHGASTVEAIADAFPLFVGAHSSIVVSTGLDGEPELAAFRDPCGVRPLVWGQTQNGSWVVCSETIGLTAAGATYGGEVAPGSLITITQDGMQQYQLAEPNPKFDPFELIYFSNKESLFKDKRIGDIRDALGRRLAAEYGRPGLNGNAVVGVPNSAKPFAAGYADALGIDYRPGAIIKHPGVGRTFMQLTEAMQIALRNEAYGFDTSLIAGMDMDVIDDSIVRGNSGPFITEQLKKAGARIVRMYIGAPPIRWPNFYGINTPKQRKLIASQMSIEAMKNDFGCRRLGFLSLEGMLKVFTEVTGEPADHFDLSCFTGDYPIPIGDRDIRQPAYSGNSA